MKKEYMRAESARRLRLVVDKKKKAEKCSAASIARALGYLPQTFSAWERGINSIPDDVAVRLGEELGCNPSWLLALDNDPKFAQST